MYRTNHPKTLSFPQMNDEIDYLLFTIDNVEKHFQVFKNEKYIFFPSSYLFGWRRGGAKNKWGEEGYSFFRMGEEERGEEKGIESCKKKKTKQKKNLMIYF